MIGNEFDLADMLDGLTLGEAVVLGSIFDGIVERVTVAPRAVEWAAWWCWRCGIAVGETAAPPPVTVVVRDVEAEALVVIATELGQVATDLRGTGLSRFLTVLSAHLLGVVMERGGEARSLGDELARLRARRATEPYTEPTAWPVVGACPPDDEV